MTMTLRFPSKAILAATTLAIFGLTVSACSTHPKAIPTWGDAIPPVASNPATVYQPGPVHSQTDAPAAFSSNGRTTFTQGCTGSFSVRDARTNREITSGRAFNSGNGLIALDQRGRQTRAVGSATSQSVTFLPDCNCRAGGNQSSQMPANHQFAATAPSGAACSAS